MGVVIRPLRHHECDLVAHIHRASATQAYAGIFPSDEPFPWDETLARWRSFAGQIVVAESDGAAEPVGFVAFDDRELHALYVLPAYWGRGIGERLLEAAGDVSELWVLQANTRARQFYERRGWAPDSARYEHHNVVVLRYHRPPRGL
jgi:GNAT superfamily N-acetyltransferase